MSGFSVDRYRSLLREAMEAFRTDPSYAEEMARQANILRARQNSRKDKSSDRDSDS